MKDPVQQEFMQAHLHACVTITCLFPLPTPQLLTEIFMKDPEQQEFMQAVREVAVSLQPVFEKRPELLPIFKQASAPEGGRGGAGRVRGLVITN